MVEARPTRHPDRGAVVMLHRVLNQDDATVLEYRSARLVTLREAV